MSKRELWLDTRGQPVITTTSNGRKNALYWGWTPAIAVPKDQEDLARTELTRWDNTTLEGMAIVIPTLKQPQEPGGLPPHWYQALAGRHIEKWGVDAQIEWCE